MNNLFARLSHFFTQILFSIITPFLLIPWVAKLSITRLFVAFCFGRLYGNRYQKIIDSFEGRYGLPMAKGLAKAKEIAGDKISVALDCGTGTGFVTKQAALEFPYTTFIAVDILHAMLKQAQENCKDIATPVFHVQADSFSQPFADRSIDLLLIQNTIPCFLEFARVCRPGGTIIYFDTSAGWITNLAIWLVDRQKIFETVLGEQVDLGFYVLAKKSVGFPKPAYIHYLFTRVSHMKIIITGATGFLGRNIAESLHNDGLQVMATGRSIVVGDELRKKGIQFVKANILDIDQLNNAFSSADCVIHCAAKSGPWGRYRDFFDTNVVGTRHVIKACKKNNIKKIILISTPSIYYTGKDRYNISESEPLPDRQRSNYSKTKLISEMEFKTLQQQGYKIIIFRPRSLYGPYDNTIIPRILRLADKKQMPLINNGQALVDLTYVDNFVDAVRKSLTASDNAWNEVYNISNGDPISIKHWFAQVLTIFDHPFKPKNVPESVAKIIAGIMELVSYLPFVQREPPMTRFTVGYISKSMTLSIDKAKQKINYSPQISNRQGFERYANWYRSEKFVKLKV